MTKLATATALILLTFGCGGPSATPRGEGPYDPGVIPSDGLRPVEPEPLPEPDVFQVAFHQALRWSIGHDQVTTYRIKVPLGGEGRRLKIAIAAGDGPLKLYRASVAFAGSGGTLASPPAQVTFGGNEGFDAAARERVVSDAVELAVRFGDELYVSYEIEGALAAGAIGLFKSSYIRLGHHALRETLGGYAEPKDVGLSSVLVEGPRRRAFVAIGDSITEGYVSGTIDDYRKSWPYIAQVELKTPFANAAVSAQGTRAALQYLDREVKVLEHITDCVMLIGTNDLSSKPPEVLIGMLTELQGELRPRCRLWAGTLIPKERTVLSDISTVNKRRAAVNAWIRALPPDVRVIDFEKVLHAPGDVNHFADGMGEDGVHPSFEGLRAMGLEAARVIAEP